MHEPPSRRSRVGAIGLGAMGLQMARHARARGFPVCGYDVEADATGRAAEVGVDPLDTLAALADRSDIVLVMVQTDRQVEEVVEESGLLAGLRPNSVICVATSTAPQTCSRLARKAAERGIGLLDTPVVLGQQAADEGRLTVLVGGEERWLETARPVLQTFGKTILHVGESGQGQLAKIVNNMLLWSTMCANFEALSLARALGADLEKLIPALGHSSGANWSLSRWGKSHPKWAEKDMDTVLDLAQAAKLPLPLHGLVDQLVKTLDNARMRGLLET